MSWIHETDLNRLFERALTEPTMRGAYIASSPHPVSQIEFMRELRLAIGMPIGLPATEWMVRFGARWLLRTDPELALYGRYVIPERLMEEHFEFQFPHLREALNDLLGRRAGQRMTIPLNESNNKSSTLTLPFVRFMKLSMAASGISFSEIRKTSSDGERIK